VLACSNGAEVYSIVWAIRSARPDLNLDVHAIDISNEILEVAKRGAYSLGENPLVNAPILERLTGDPGLTKRLGPQDIVVANKFLCHMAPPDAERCLRNLTQLVSPGGYLFVSGIDLDVRTKVAVDLSWTPVPSLLEEIHNGDPSVRHDWPWKYWGLEPFDSKRRDWSIRYAEVFQLGSQN
jgi:SAM-dependent methyltransferase